MIAESPAGHATTADAAATLRRILANGAALLGAYAGPRALTFLAALIAARVLQPAAFGGYATASALAMMLSILATLGMLPLLIRNSRSGRPTRRCSWAPRTARASPARRR